MLLCVRLNAAYNLACDQRTVFDPHALTLVKWRRLVIREVTRLAAFHMHAYRIVGAAAQMFFDRIAAETAPERAENRHAGTTTPTSKLITDKTTRHRAANRTNAGSLPFMPYGRDCFHRAAARAISRLSGGLLRVVGLLHGYGLLSYLGRRLLLLLGLLSSLGCCALLGLLLSKLLLLRLLLLGSSRSSGLRGRLHSNLRRLGLIVGRRCTRRFREQASDRGRSRETGNDHRAGCGSHERMDLALAWRVRIR